MIDPAALLEIRSELGITDVVQGTDASHTTRIEQGLRTLQRKFDVQLSVDRWKHFSNDDEIVHPFSKLVDDELSNQDRDGYLSELRDRARQLGAVNGW